MFRRAYLQIFVFFLLSSCGFVPKNWCVDQARSICVAPICSDPDGHLQVAIATELVRSGFFCYQVNHTDLMLCVEVEDLCDENVGFRYDRNKEGKLTDILIPAESRAKIAANVKVLDCAGQLVKGPYCVTEEVDFDHDFYLDVDAVNVFSLGQVTDVEAAEDAALKPLYRRLARKIVRYLDGL